MSETLGRLSNKLRVDTDSKFRNANGISMKMMNFRRFDISYDGVGLTRGGKDEKVVWDLYSDKPQELPKIVKSIRKLIETNVELPPTIDEQDEEDLEEGKLRTRFDKVRERNTKTVKKKKEDFLKKNGRLYCEVCDFNFIKEYG
jgi:5-methylcytosine-specific restriction protein A